jgi:four helix bundle protein
MCAIGDALAEQKRFVISSQVISSATSVPANIAEGQGRASTRDRRHFLVQARGSLYELDTHLEIAVRAGYVDDIAAVRGKIAQIGCGLTKMIDRLSSTQKD